MTEPTACPRCGSDDPNRHLRVTNGWDHVYCDDEWHDRPTGGLADAVEASLRERGITIPDRPTGADDLAARLDDRVRRHTEFKRRWDRLHAADDEREQTRG